MLLYKCFRFSEVMDQTFLTVRCVVQGSFRAKLCAAPVFVHVALRQGWGAWKCFPHLVFPLGVNQDYLDFSGGIFDL